MKTPLKLMEELIGRAAFEQGCIAPSQRGKLRLFTDPYRRPGGMIENLKPEDRAILQGLTTEDLNKHRLDWVLIWTPVGETWERFLKTEKNRYKNSGIN